MKNRYNINTTDNTTKHPIADIGDLEVIANIPINEIDKGNLLVFPQDWTGGISGEYPPIFKYNKFTNELKTNNIMGFIGKGNTELFIKSRFDDKNNNNYFLHYMLQKVFSLNVVNLDISSGNESILDLLPYLFPALLQDALLQGLFKQYKRSHYNDSNIKGTIDINRHIKLNIPFTGKIAYTTREHSIDNSVTQLIRHTIEYLRTRPIGHSVLSGNSEIRANVSKIEYATPNYKRGNLRKIILENRKIVNHPYFTKYRPLQKLCLQILRQENVNVGDKDELHGVLFDGAWLWEEYLNKVFIEQKLDFKHTENKNNKKPIYLFEKNKYPRYPDFYKECFILDAKYKRLDNESSIDRNDIHQIISYMYIKKAKLGGFIHPVEYEQSENPRSIGTLNGYGGEVKIWSLKIPQNANDFNKFKKEINESENKLPEKIKVNTC